MGSGGKPPKKPKGGKKSISKIAGIRTHNKISSNVDDKGRTTMKYEHSSSEPGYKTWSVETPDKKRTIPITKETANRFINSKEAAKRNVVLYKGDRRIYVE